MTNSDNSDLDVVDYDPATDTYVGTFEESDEVSAALAEALADVRHCQTTDLDPLYHSIDTDALDSLVASAQSVTISLGIDGFDVRLDSDGRIEITPPE